MEQARTHPRAGELSNLLAPFPGLRYDPRVVPRLDEVLAPPHTEMDRSTRATLMATRPYLVTHLERPPQGTTGESVPLVEQWLASGVLRRDVPGFYLLTQEDAQGRHTFLLGQLTVRPDEDRVVPHEDVFDQAVRARRDRLLRTRVDSEPVLLLDDGSWRQPWADAEGLGAVVLDAVGQDRRVRLRHVTDPDLLSSWQRDAAQHSFLIADGHHRYAAVRQAGQESGHPQELLVAIADQRLNPVRLRPLHRVLPIPAASALLAAATDVRTWENLGRTEIVRRADALDGRQVLLVDGPGGRVHLLSVPASFRQSPTWVDHVVAHRGIPDSAVVFVAGTTQALTAGADQLVALQPTVTLAHIRAWQAPGTDLGRKTTSFHPKPIAGAVLRTR